MVQVSMVEFVTLKPFYRADKMRLVVSVTWSTAVEWG